MRKIYLFLIFSVLSISLLWGQTQIYHYGFETANGYTTAHPEHNDGSYDYFGRFTNDSIAPNYNNPDGLFFFAAQDIDADGGVNPDTLFINGIDVTTALSNDLTFSVYLAEAATGWDDGDYVHFYYRFDGGNYENLLWFENDGSAYNSPAYQDTDFDGVGDGQGLTSTFTEFTATIPKNGFTLDIMVVFSLDAGSEDIAIDSISIYDGQLTILPSLLNAYAISSNTLLLKYDNDLLTVNADDYLLINSNGDTLTFSSASIDANDASIVYLTAASDFAVDNLVDTVKDNANNTEFTLYASIFPLYYTNSLYADHIQNDINATFIGVATAVASNKVWIQDAGGALNGVYVYDNNFDSVAVGSKFMIVGQRTEYYGLTELKNIIYVQYIGNVEPIVTEIPSSELIYNTPQNTAPAESWEGQLVKIFNLTPFDYNSSYNEYLAVSDNGDTILIDDGAWPSYGGNEPLTLGNKYNITGVVNYSYSKYRLNPRSADDIEEIAQPVNDTNNIDIAFTFLNDHYILVAYENKFDTVNLSFFTLKSGDTVYTPSNGIIYGSDSLMVILYFDQPLTFDLTIDTIYDSYHYSSFGFYAGIAPLNYFNTVSPEGTILDGVVLTTAAKVTANDNYNQVWLQDREGPMHGLLVYQGNTDICSGTQVGDSIFVLGYRTVYNGMTELVPFYYKILDSNTNVVPTNIEVADIDTSIAQDTEPAELWEGQLVKISNVEVIDYNSSTYEYLVKDANGNVAIIDDDVWYHYDNPLEIGNKYNITGVVTYSYGHYKLNPRDSNDIELVPAPIADAIIIAPEMQIEGDTMFIDENYNFQNAVAVIKFGIVDLGQDGLSTNVTRALALAGPDNTANFDLDLDGGVLMDENNVIISYTEEPTITADSAILPVNPADMTIADGDTVFYTAYLWLDTNTVTDGHILQMMVAKNHGFQADPNGSQFVDSLDNDIVGNTFIITTHQSEPSNVIAYSYDIYPNPAVNFIKVNGKNIVKAEIYSLDGQLISLQDVNNNVINVANIPVGAYILKMYTDDNKVIVHKVVKQ